VAGFIILTGREITMQLEKRVQLAGGEKRVKSKDLVIFIQSKTVPLIGDHTTKTATHVSPPNGQH
jgi:hypothetical protein